MNDLNLQHVIELNNELTAQEKHFNSLCADYRKIASGWLLATFSGIGFSLTQKQALPFAPELFIALIGYAGSIGMLLLWNIDIAVYHRLLDAAFMEGLKLEQEYPQLPQVRHNMMKLHGGRGVQPRINWFYTMPIMALLMVSTWNIQVATALQGWQVWVLWLSLLFTYSAFSYYVRNESTVGLRKKVK